MGRVLCLVTCLLFAACTKQSNNPTTESGKPMLNAAQDPQRVILEAKVALPAEFKSKVKPSDVLIWDLKTGTGEMVASELEPLPKFPHTFRIEARQLRQPIPQDSILLFSARVVHFGEEYKPPVKGQLIALVGVVPSKEEVINPNVDKKRFANWAKKNHFAEEKVLNVGSKVDADLTPSVW
ncbi:MAG: hypothetical protein ACXWQO_06520 [Bdellovibrionota bacterium]